MQSVAAFSSLFVSFCLQNGMINEMWHFCQQKCYHKNLPELLNVEKNERNFDIQKLCMSNVYTTNMGGIDRADQMQSFYTVRRQS